MIATITINPLTLGTYASGYLFNHLEGFDFPKARLDVRDHGQRHGARLGIFNYGRRLFIIDGTIVGSSFSDYESKRRALQAAVDLDVGLQWMTITTKAGLSVQAQVIVNVELTEPYKAGDGVFGDFHLQLVAPFPYLLSLLAQSVDIRIAAGGGTPIPAAIPMDLSAGQSASQIVTNNGNAKAYPIITITGAIQNPSIQNATTGLSLSLVYTLTTPTDYITLDFYNRTALYNGVTNILQYVSSDWWTLSSGANTIRLTSAVTNSLAIAQLSFNDSYLGI